MEDLKYFVVLYLHWHHKDHNGAVEAVYSTKPAAINHINLRKKESKYFLANHDKTFLAVQQVKQTNYKQLQYSIHMVIPVHMKKQTGKVTLKINVRFPSEVSCMQGQNQKQDYVEKLHDRIREHVDITVLDKHTDKTKLNFSTQGDKVMEFVCDCMVRD